MGQRGQKRSMKVEPPRGAVGLGPVVWDAYLKIGEGQGAPPDAWRDARDRYGIKAESAEAGVLAEVFGGGPVSPAAAREGRRLLADGYREALAKMDPAEAGAHRERVARAAARAVGEVPLSLTLALEDAGDDEELQRLVDAAVSAAVGRSPAPAPATVDGWLEEMARGGAPDPDRVLLAALALEVDARRGARLVRLAEESASAALLRFVSELPDLIQEPTVARTLGRSERPGARAVLARALAQDDERCEAALTGLFPAIDPGTAERAARLYGDLEAAGGHQIASHLVEHLAGRWPEEIAPADVVERAALPPGRAVSFLCGMARSLGRKPLALACHEAVLQRGLAQMEGDGDPASVLEASTRSAVALVRAGQGMAVASQLLGAGVQVTGVEAGSLTEWARLNLEIGRATAESHPNDALLFYVNLVSLYARAPDRLVAFGPASPLLWRVRSRLHVVEPAGSSGEEAFSRAARERHLQDLARLVMEADGGHRPQMGVSAPQGESQEPRRDAPAAPPAVPSVSGVRLDPPSRSAEALRVFTGIEFFRRVLSYPVRWLGYRRSGTLEIRPDRLTLEQTTRFLGQRIRSERQEIPAAQVARVRRMERSPASLLVLGIVVLVVLTWLGVSVTYDGFSIGDGVLISAGLGAVALGLVLAGALYALFRSVRAATFVTVFLRGKTRPVRIAVPRADGDRVVAALRSLDIDVNA